MNILIYKGKFQYGVVDLFIDTIAEILEKRKHNVFLINLSDTDAMNKIVNSFTNQLIDCVIGFNGIGVDVKLNNNQSIYDVVNTNFLAIYVDHPAHLMSRIIEPIKNHLISFIDKEHVNFINEVLPQNHKISFFLPHGGLPSGTMNVISVEQYKEEKEIDILFSGSFMGEIRKDWEISPFFPKEIIEKVCEKLIYDDYSTIHKVFEEVCTEEGIKFSLISKAQLSKLFVQIITYTRQFKRNMLIKRIIESGLNITICGKNWGDFISGYKNVDYRGELNIQDTLKLINKSKILVNATPNFTNGSHERVFTGMLHNTVIFSDKSKYYDELFDEGETILYYSLNSIDKDIEILKTYLKDHKKLFDMSKKAYFLAHEKHRWENRVDRILEMIQLSKMMDM